MRITTVCLLALAGASIGCGGSDATQAVALKFAANVDGAPARCGTTYTDLGTAGSSAQLASARMYVSNVELRDAGGTWVPLTLDEGTRWQGEGVTLLDFDDASAKCADTGTPGTNDQITGTLPAGTYDALRFTLGVPFALNPGDTASASPPLDEPTMFWTWNNGRQFLSVDWAVDDGAVPEWKLHIGSTACASSGPPVPPDAECGRPNRATIELDDFHPDADVVAVDLGALIAGANISTNVADTPPGCMTGLTEADDCSAPFSAIGLSFETGACVEGCTGQTVFTVASRAR